jgi:hypothetical protein
MSEESKKAKRKRLRQIRIEHAEDGTVVHHHTYQGDDGQDEPERMNVATSRTPQDAGQHVEDQLGMNENAAPDDAAAGEGAPADAAPVAPTGQ